MNVNIILNKPIATWTMRFLCERLLITKMSLKIQFYTVSIYNLIISCSFILIYLGAFGSTIEGSFDIIQCDIFSTNVEHQRRHRLVSCIVIAL